MSKVRPCVACARPMSAAFEACPFCGAAQPKIVAPPKREQRCATCGRLYSATFEVCPFCADVPLEDGSAPYREPAVARKAPAPARVDVVETDDFRWKGLAVGLALLTVLGAARGLLASTGNEHLGGEEGSGLLVPSVVLGLLLGAGLGFVVARAVDAFDEASGPKIVVFLSLVATGPASLTAYALLDGVNGLFAEGRERELSCEVLFKDQHHRRGTDLGWRLGYSCVTDDGALVGTYRSRDEPPGTPKGHVTFRASPGLLGRWVRRSEPVGPPPPAPPTRPVPSRAVLPLVPPAPR